MKIVIACGGTSPERGVSLNSGKAVYDALSGTGIYVQLVDVKSIKEFIINWDSYKADGVFMALHGGWGENGEFQSAMDTFDIPYTGSNAKASMLGMDKFISKLIFKENNILVPEGLLIKKSNYSNEKVCDFLDKHKKIIVKPNCGGSTVGVTVVTDKSQIESAVKTAWESEPDALAEEFIEGTEVTVPVFEDEKGTVFSMPVVEICPKCGFYDYKNKYTPGATEYICPATLEKNILENLSEMAIRVHKILGCSVYSRVDFRIGKEGKIYALEINTAPGMTSTSLVPKSARALGIDFSSFLSKVIHLSF